MNCLILYIRHKFGVYFGKNSKILYTLNKNKCTKLVINHLIFCVKYDKIHIVRVKVVTRSLTEENAVLFGGIFHILL